MNVLTKNNIFNEYTLNIFTDASLTKVNDECITCSGAVAVTAPDINSPETQIIDSIYRINRASTNNIGEIIGIELGIDLALKWRGQFSTINLFSDSKISLFGLREWFTKWKYNPNTGLLYGSAGTPIANQSHFLKIMYAIVQYGLVINLYHVPGHADFNKFIKVFRESNNVHSFIDRSLITEMIKYNDFIDESTRSTLMNYVSSPVYRDDTILDDPLQYMYNPDFNMSDYKSLINFNEV